MDWFLYYKDLGYEGVNRASFDQKGAKKVSNFLKITIKDIKIVVLVILELN